MVQTNDGKKSININMNFHEKQNNTPIYHNHISPTYIYIVIPGKN